MTGRTNAPQSPPPSSPPPPSPVQQPPSPPALPPRGRGAELAALAALSDRSGPDAPVLVLAGDPGLGRTALTDWAARSFTPGPVLRVRASRAESALPLSGVHALACAAGGLPGPWTTDDTEHGTTPEWLLHSLTATAARSPLLVCVDDAHLWDAPSRTALGFAARRLPAAGPVRLLLTVAGQHAADPDFAALPALTLGPLPSAAMDALLDDTACGPVDPAVRMELLDEAEGNPALLRALLAGLSPAELSGEHRLPWPPADAEALRSVAGAHLAGFSAAESELLLLVAAAHEHDPEGGGADADLVRGAAARLDRARAALGQDRLPDALVLSGGRFRFTSPLLRRAVHACAPPDRRRAAHRALACVLESVPEDAGHGLVALLHRAWSIAGHAPPMADQLSAAAADPCVAASRAQRAAAYARAAELTADGRERAEHLTAAAGQALLAGRAREARRLTGRAGDGALPAVVRGRSAWLRGIIALRDGPAADAGEALLLARSLLAHDDPAHALLAGLAAAEAAWATGDAVACLRALDAADRTAGTTVQTRAVAHGRAVTDRPATRSGVPPSPARAGEADSLPWEYLHGMRAMLEQDFARAVPRLRRVVKHAWEEDGPERLLRSGAAALLLGDVPAACRIGARTLAAALSRGPEASVPRALELLAYAELRTGQHARARAHAEEGLRAAHRYGQSNVAAHHHAVLALAASIADESTLVAHHADAALITARRHGLSQATTLAEWASARADLGRGRPFEAAARLGPLVRPGPDGGHFAVRMLVMPCYVEAAVLAGQRADAHAVVEEFALWARFGADVQAPAQLARCRALVADADRADALYEDALALHARAGGDFEQARTRLLYGKWLRRRRRLREAGGCLRAALVAFERCGARIWADQARAELRANGVAPAAAGAGALEGLTPQQLRIARCVAEGATNREVALRLAVSTRTVDYHLRKVFAVLGVRSRVELSRMVERPGVDGSRPA
ncbi:helix-turn-helix transcriptional regulator [Streptomyces ortus]|uniref:Helix-turn-helix transcriptional regulator n=1 Tax=Streptomyces ortus TaxID=2867268 RepID=A0ABT3VEZ4_9ACTN|nr:helix-turn-helix transcriptional regulator [Streptomyces ortus]MCX4238451.1 helix-turn-helix transcriptional regulator [Streptomyces ortus]